MRILTVIVIYNRFKIKKKTYSENIKFYNMINMVVYYILIVKLKKSDRGYTNCYQIFIIQNY